MGLAKSLTNDLDRAVKLYRVPILNAIAFSFRNALEDRFLITDPRTEDERRNVIKLSRVTRVEQKMTKLDIGVDSRQFVDMSGLLLFQGMQDPNGSGRIIPVPSVSITGGRTDSNDVNFTATGTTEQKQAKLKRYVQRRPEDVTWRVRSPILMANETSVIDYLALRATQLQFLHSIAIKWSDRRWDGRAVPVSVDMFRPQGEKSQMIVLAPVWMNEEMTILDPNIWGPYESIIRTNYEEYLGRHDDEYRQDLLAFVDRFQDYEIVLKPGSICSSQAQQNLITVGRLERKLTTTYDRTLRIGFDRSLDTRNDSYHSRYFDPKTSTDATGDVFNFEDTDGTWRITSSFEAATLDIDGWHGTGTLAQDSDIPANLPPYAQTRTHVDVHGTKSLSLTEGFVARRVILPDGNFCIRLWVKNVAGDCRVEVVRNTRLKPKQITVNEFSSRVTSIEHFRESYETITSAVLHPDTVGWRQVFISFPLKDHFFVPNEGYPAHEVFIVLSTVDGTATHPQSKFDHLELLVDQLGHDIEIINTTTHAKFPDLYTPQEKVVNLEAAFATDTEFLGRERAGSFFRFDGDNVCCVAKHRNSYNFHPTGTNLNAWWKVNSVDEAAHDVLNRRGNFNLFQKGATYLPSYRGSVDSDKKLNLSWGTAGSASSAGFRNWLIHPSVSANVVPPVINWADPTGQASRYKTIFTVGGNQAREWFDGGASTVVTLAAAAAGINVGPGKTLVVSSNDPYLTAGIAEMADPASGITLWMYFEWHARNAYRTFLPPEQVISYSSFSDFAQHYATGDVMLPVPLNSELVDVPANLGVYSPSPGAFSPAFYPGGAIAPWPISPCAWGTQGFGPWWPGAPGATVSPYGSPPAWIPFNLASIVDVDSLYSVAPMFAAGALSFDRWFNLDMNADQSAVDIRINGALLATGGGNDFNVTLDKENSDDLWIGTTDPDNTDTCSPVSCWSFKISQAKYTGVDIQALVESEAINFNELLYNLYAAYLDFDRDKQLDFYQESLTDFSLETTWVDPFPSPISTLYGVFPSDDHKIFGKVVVSAPDPIEISPQLDRNRDVIDDDFDSLYLQGLVNAQTIGYSDGLLFWDFLTPTNAVYHSFTHRVYDPTCNGYKNVTLDYKPWLEGLITQDFNDVTAITDPVPTLSGLGLSPSVSPQPSQPPTFGQTDEELLMPGIKGWFRFGDLLGYRDSLAQLEQESMIFDYLQIELRFRAGRTELDTHLRNYADSYGDLFSDNFPGHRLQKLDDDEKLGY